jgi:hypothetical protein
VQLPAVETPAVRLRADPHASAGQRRAHPPRDYLRRDEQRRLLWRVMPPALLVVILAAWLEHVFWRVPPPPSPPQVDTRLSGGPRGSLDGRVADAVLIEPEPARSVGGHPREATVRERWGPPEALDRVRDDTVFRETDRAAWVALWDLLDNADPERLAAAAGPAVGFTELYGQPESFRGCPIRLRGTLRRLQWIPASPQSEQALADKADRTKGYWQGWLDPEGGPPSPIVVYFRRLPATIRPGLRIIEPVDVVGIFFKRWAYPATDTIRTAPLIIAIEPVPLTSVSRKSTPPVGVVAAFAAVFAVAAAVFVARRSRRRRPRRSVAATAFVLAASLLPSAVADDGDTMVARGRTEKAATSLDDYLHRFDLDARSRDQSGPLTIWNDERQDIVLRLLPRLTTAPAEWLRRWGKEAVLPEAVSATTPNTGAAGQGLVRVIGRAAWVVPLVLSPTEAERHARTTVDVVRIVGDDGTAVDVIAGHVPQAWPRDTVFDEPADAVGVLVAQAAGPHLSPPPQVTMAAADGAAGLVLAAPRVAWRPGTPLGSLGMDYGLFDTVRDGQRLVAADADAFYALLAAVGRGTQRGIAAAAGPPVDVIPLIDPAADWFATHRGDPIHVRGTARRALRITIDDPSRRDEVGSDHYWELSVFVRTPIPLKVNGRLQDTYPIVCCVRELPPGMPSGERIAEEVDLAGFAFKRYRYPLSDAAAEPGGDPPSQESPLLVGSRVSWVQPRGEETVRRFDRFVGGLLAIVLLLIVTAVFSSLLRRRQPPMLRTIAPPLSDQDAAAGHGSHGGDG